MKKGLRGIREKKVAGRRTGIRPGKVFIYALALAALGGSGYLLYDRIRKRKSGGSRISSNSTDSIADEIVNTITTADNVSASNAVTTTAKPSKRAKATDNFPLKKGSKGARVMQLQQALISKGASIQADGIFGSETLAALRAAGHSDSVDESIFSKITAGQAGTIHIVFNPGDLARKLYRAADMRNVQEVVNILRQVKTVSEYSTVNDYYKKLGFISRTIVTHLLDSAFKNEETALQSIKDEFKRIGLKVNELGIWSLQGIQLYKDLITIRPTIVMDGWDNRIPVKGNTILGDEVKIENGMTWFRSVDRTVLRVPTQDVKYT